MNLEVEDIRNANPKVIYVAARATANVAQTPKRAATTHAASGVAWAPLGGLLPSIVRE